MGKACTRGLSAREDSARDSGHREETDRIARIVVALHPEDGRRDRVQVGRAGRGEWRRSSSADRREGNLERGAGDRRGDADRRGIEAPGCGGDPANLRGLVVVHDHAMIVVVVIKPAGIVMAMVMVAVVVMMGTVVMVMAVATRMHVGTPVAVRVGKEGERAHAGRHQGDRQEEHRMESQPLHVPSLRHDPAIGIMRAVGFTGMRLSHACPVPCRGHPSWSWDVGASSIAVRPRRWSSTIARPIASPTFM